MTDYFALLDEARRPWLDPEKLKEKYFALSRVAAPDAELNEAYRVLERSEIAPPASAHAGRGGSRGRSAGAAVGRGIVLEYRHAFARSGALAAPEFRKRARRSRAPSSRRSGRSLRAKSARLEEQLRATYESELEQLRQFDAAWSAVSPNESARLIGSSTILFHTSPASSSRPRKRDFSWQLAEQCSLEGMREPADRGAKAAPTFASCVLPCFRRHVQMLTPGQKDVLQFIQSEQRSKGLTPSTREIQEHFGFASQTSVMQYLARARAKGFSPAPRTQGSRFDYRRAAEPGG